MAIIKRHNIQHFVSGCLAVWPHLSYPLQQQLRLRFRLYPHCLNNSVAPSSSAPFPSPAPPPGAATSATSWSGHQTILTSYQNEMQPTTSCPFPMLPRCHAWQTDEHHSLPPPTRPLLRHCHNPSKQQATRSSVSLESLHAPLAADDKCIYVMIWIPLMTARSPRAASTPPFENPTIPPHPSLTRRLLSVCLGWAQPD